MYISERGKNMDFYLLLNHSTSISFLGKQMLVGPNSVLSEGLND